MLKKNTNEIGSQLIHFPSNNPATRDNFTDNTHILIHGFTANGKELETLATHLTHNGLNCLIYNYDSFIGIDMSANSFVDLLKSIIPDTKNNDVSFTIVAHSMGGLVARYIDFLCRNTNYNLNKIITLGTPHQGVFDDPNMLIILHDYFEATTRIKVHKNKTASLEQLMRIDNKEVRFGLIDRLNKMKTCPIISISGGKPFLKISEGRITSSIRNKAFNSIFQAIANNEINDGLILENSSDITNLKNGNRYTHHNSYAEYSNLNHSNLIKNQYLANYISNCR